MSDDRPNPSNPLAAYLTGRRPLRNAAPGVADLRATNLALAAEFAPRFLRPDVDARVEAEAMRASADAPPGAVAETLAARGLLPPELDPPSTFDVAWPRVPFDPNHLRYVNGHVGLAAVPWWHGDSLAEDPDGSLPFLVARWRAVSAGLALLDEAADRLVPWGWATRPHRVVVVRHVDAATFLHTSEGGPTRSLSGVMAGPHSEGSEANRWDYAGDLPFWEAARAPWSNSQARITLDGYTRWEAYAAERARVSPFLRRWVPPAWSGRTFADMPNPFAPFVDILRLGLAAVPVDVGGPQLVLLVPRESL